MNITYLKNLALRKNRCFIGLIIVVLMFSPMSNLFADTVVCKSDAALSMNTMNDKAMACCAEVDMCNAECDLSMFSAPVLLDSDSVIAFIKPDVRYRTYQSELLPFLPPPPLIRPPVSV